MRKLILTILMLAVAGSVWATREAQTMFTCDKCFKTAIAPLGNDTPDGWIRVGVGFERDYASCSTSQWAMEYGGGSGVSYERVAETLHFCPKCRTDEAFQLEFGKKLLADGLWFGKPEEPVGLDSSAYITTDGTGILTWDDGSSIDDFGGGIDWDALKEQFPEKENTE